jgi:glycosyltransferase involved in cell wall biosynthesis
MNILVAYSDLKVGGVQHMTTQLANAWVASGHRVTICLTKREPELELYPLDPQVELVDFAAERVRGFITGLIKLLRERRGQYDILYTATTVPNIAATLARIAARSRIRHVVSERDNPEWGFKALTKRSDRLIWSAKPWAYKRAHGVVCVSTPLADALARYAKMPRAAIRVVHNPAEPTDKSFLNAPPPHPWFVDRDRPIIVAAGRIHRQKDFPMLVRSFAALRKRRPVRLALLGDGPERAEVEKTIDEVGLREDILLPGMQRDIMPWLAHGDLFAMSSTFEGFGNVLVQALAAGVPIVSTDCPDGPAEILDDGKYGLLTPVGDTEAMGAAMDRALKMPRTPEIQRARARDFSVESIAQRYLDFFEELV